MRRPVKLKAKEPATTVCEAATPAVNEITIWAWPRRIIVPFSPGESSEVVAARIAGKLNEFGYGASSIGGTLTPGKAPEMRPRRKRGC